MKIVICDDSRMDRENLISLLGEYEQRKGIGFDIAEYDSGEALLENTAVLKDCQIIFMDINMEQMSGLEASVIIAGCDIITSWNFKHIVNVKTARGVKTITTMEGYADLPTIGIGRGGRR